MLAHKKATGAVEFCAPVDRTPWVGVLGILTAHSHRHLRDAIRFGWASAWTSGEVLPRFVVRGYAGSSAEASMAAEATNGDLVFVRANDSLGRSAGPLASLVLWYECALRAWPFADHIGKADDDVWVDLPRVAAHLRGTVDVLRTQYPGAAPQIYWGMMESWSWDVSGNRPTDGRTFGYKYPAYRHCLRNARKWADVSGWVGKRVAGSAWLGLAWLGLAWLGLAWLD